MEAAEHIWRPLGELLMEKGLLRKDELELALAEQAESGRLLGAILVDHGFVSGPALAITLAEQMGVELRIERGFGTGLWAAIDRRHRAGRANGDANGDGVRPHRGSAGDNVVTLEPVKPLLQAVPDRDHELERLETENARLQEEIDRLRGEFTRLKVIETPAPASSHLLFVPTPARYLLLARDGAPPEPGSVLEVPEAPGSFTVAKIGAAPHPGEPRPCAFLLALE